MASQRVEFEIKRIYELPTHYDRMEYIRNIPDRIRARVVGEILDRGKEVDYIKRAQIEIAEYLRKKEERIQKGISSFSIPSF